MLKVIAPGTKVRLAGEVPAVVTAVSIREMGLDRYEVAWWSGATRSCAWVEPHEVAAAEDETLVIGFVDAPVQMTPGEERILAQTREVLHSVEKIALADKGTW
jgi:hypothetical protein